MAISESGDHIYYCFHQQETNGEFSGDADSRQEVDAYCAVGTRDAVNGWTWTSPRVALGGINDDRDQFAPEVMVTREGGTYTANEEVVAVTWYDRSDDPNNLLYKVKKSVSTDKGVTFQVARSQFVPFASSDPDLLPRHCRAPDVRFIGDYSGAEGDPIHGHSLSVIVPSQMTIGTTVMSNFVSLGDWEE